MADNPPPQRDRDLVSYGAFTGVRNDVTEERLGPTDLATGDNIDLDVTGKVSLRAGQTKLTATATHSLWSDQGDISLCVQGTSLMRIAADFSLSVVRTGLTAGLPMSYTKVNDTVYATNGRESLAFSRGVARSWGLPVPPLPSVSVGLGALVAGSYQFVMTYVRSDGQESGAGLAGRVAVAGNSALTFSFPAPADSDIAYCNVYMSPPDGKLLYLALTVRPTAGSATYAGDTAEFSYQLSTQFLSPPPPGQLVSYYSSHFYVAVDDAIYPSEPYAYELFDLRKYMPMPGRVTMIAPLDDKEVLDRPGMNSGIFVGTDRSCGTLVGSEPGGMQYVPKLDYGVVEGSLDYVEGTLYTDGKTGAQLLPMWLTTKGVCIGMPGLDIRNITRSRYKLSAAGRGASFVDPDSKRFVAVSNF